MLTAVAILLSVTALFAWINERFIKIPTTVGVTLAGALASVILTVLSDLGVAAGLRTWAERMLETLDFTGFVLNGILSVLLFAGAMSQDARAMLRHRGSILTLATLSTIISTAIVGFGSWAVFRLVGLDVPLMWALLFGALISPTDPVAVLDLLKRAAVPKKIQTLIAGESLFNDGVGVVLFLVVARLAGTGGAHSVEASVGSALLLFVREALGGMLFGALLGCLCYYLCKTIDGHVVEVLITLATVLGGYVAAAALGLSGPLAMVVAGLIMSAGKEVAFYRETREHVEGFWETLDQVLNVLLFAFIGLDVLLAATSGRQIAASALMIPLVLAARLISVAVPFHVVRRREGFGRYTVRLLTWGGLRGGIAISLALGLPAAPYRLDVVTATYVVVLFSIAVQGLTVLPLARRASASDPGLEQTSR